MTYRAGRKHICVFKRFTIPSWAFTTAVVCCWKHSPCWGRGELGPKMASPPNFHYFGHSSSYFSCVGTAAHTVNISHRVSNSPTGITQLFLHGNGACLSVKMSKKRLFFGHKPLHTSALRPGSRATSPSSSGCPWNVMHRVQNFYREGDHFFLTSMSTWGDISWHQEYF